MLSKEAINRQRKMKYDMLNEFYKLELEGIIELYKECVAFNFNNESTKITVYSVIGTDILTDFWIKILEKSFAGGKLEYDPLKENLKKNLYKIDPNILFYCILTEFEKNQLFGSEDQIDIVNKLLLLTHQTYVSE